MDEEFIQNLKLNNLWDNPDANSAFVLVEALELLLLNTLLKKLRPNGFLLVAFDTCVIVGECDTPLSIACAVLLANGFNKLAPTAKPAIVFFAGKIPSSNSFNSVILNLPYAN